MSAGRSRNFQPPARGQATATDVISMTDEDLDAATRPDVDADKSLSVADNIEIDPSVDGIEEEIVLPSSEEITDSVEAEKLQTELTTAPPVPATMEISGESIRNRKDALRMFRIRPRVTQRVRVPHPLGQQPMWLNLTKNQEINVPKYVRDHLYEKGML